MAGEAVIRQDGPNIAVEFHALRTVRGIGGVQLSRGEGAGCGDQENDETVKPFGATHWRFLPSSAGSRNLQASSTQSRIHSKVLREGTGHKERGRENSPELVDGGSPDAATTNPGAG